MTRPSSFALAFSPDGKILATLPVASNQGTLKLWDTATRHEVDLLAVVPDDARALAFMPDGHSLVTAGSSVNLWGWAGLHLAFHTLKGKSKGSSDRSLFPRTCRSMLCRWGRGPLTL